MTGGRNPFIAEILGDDVNKAQSELIRRANLRRFNDEMWTVEVGIVESYDRTTKRARVKRKRAPDGAAEAGVPVMGTSARAGIEVPIYTRQEDGTNKATVGLLVYPRTDSIGAHGDRRLNRPLVLDNCHEGLGPVFIPFEPHISSDDVPALFDSIGDKDMVVHLNGDAYVLFKEDGTLHLGASTNIVLDAPLATGGQPITGIGNPGGTDEPVPAGTQIIADAGLTGTGTLESDVTLAVGAGPGITVNDDDVALAASAAGAGLTYTSGVLDVVAAAGSQLTVETDSIDWDGLHVRHTTTDFQRRNIRFVTGPGIDVTLNDDGVEDEVEIQIDSDPTDAGGAPSDAQYLTLATDGDLSNERVLTPGTGLDATDAGADGAYTLDVNLSPFSTDDLSEGTNLYYTDERAQDAIGTILLDTDSIDLTYDDATPNIKADVLVGNALAVDATGVHIPTDAIQLDELDQSIAPTWTGFHTFSGNGNIAQFGDGTFNNKHITIRNEVAGITLGLHADQGRALLQAGENKSLAFVADEAGGFGAAGASYDMLLAGDGLLTVTNRITGLTQATGTTDAVAAGRTLTGGTGISAIGDFTADRTVALDTAATVGFTGEYDFTSGTLRAGTPSETTHVATKDYVDSNIQGLDWNESVLDKNLSSPPASPSEGDRYIVAGESGDGTATGDWATHEEEIAEWDGSAWIFTVPDEGFAVWVEDEDVLYVFNGADPSTGNWVKFGSTVDHGNLIGLGDDDHTQYVHKDTARTITAQHDFAPASAQAPFTLGTNAQGQKVTGLHADQVDGYEGADLAVRAENETITGSWTFQNAVTLQTQATSTDHAVAGGRTLTGGDGIAAIGNLTADRTIAVDLASSAGLKFTTGQLAVEPAHFAGTFLSDDGSDNLQVDIGRGLENDGSGNIRVDEDTDFTFTQQIDLDAGATHGATTLPQAPLGADLGTLQTKYGQIHAAELVVETLVAQDTAATIGGRILVATTTFLREALDATETDIDVEHNNLESGDIVVLQADGKTEYMSIDSAPSGTGPYTYTVTRDLDGTGANTWDEGDAVVGTGQTGEGFIDLYSASGLDDGVGPTITGNVRQSATYNDWVEGWAIGNLEGLYGYSAQTFGVALGEYKDQNTFVTVDDTDGIRLVHRDASSVESVIGQWDTDGSLTLGEVAASKSNLHFDPSTGELLFRVNTTSNIKLNTDGEIQVGATTNDIVLDGGVPSLAFGGTTGFNGTTGIWIGDDGGTYKLRIGDNQTTGADYLSFDGSVLEISGTFIDDGNSSIQGTSEDTFTLNKGDATDPTVSLVFHRASGDGTLSYDGSFGLDKDLDVTGTVSLDGLTAPNRFSLSFPTSGVYDDATSNSPYSRVNADSFHTNGLGVGQLFIEGRAIDSNTQIYIGRGVAGGQSPQSVRIGSDLLATGGEVIWDESATHIPQARLQNDSVTITPGTGLNSDGDGTLALGDTETYSVTLSPFSTSDLSEGSNLYHTTERAQDATGAMAGTGLVYTDATPDLSVTLSPFSTSDLSEGSNLYFTDERAQDAVGTILGSGLTYNDATPSIVVTESQVDHDQLQNFVADEHVAHSSVVLTAGAGISGGGDISASRTFDLDLTTSGGLQFDGTGNARTVSVDEANVDHDALSNFVADEHVAHSGVNITAGAGLTGGGDISASRTLNVVGGAHITAQADQIDWDGLQVEKAGSLVGTRRILNISTKNEAIANVTDDGTEIDVELDVQARGIEPMASGRLKGLELESGVKFIGHPYTVSGSNSETVDIATVTGESGSVDTSEIVSEFRSYVPRAPQDAFSEATAALTWLPNDTATIPYIGVFTYKEAGEHLWTAQTVDDGGLGAEIIIDEMDTASNWTATSSTVDEAEGNAIDGQTSLQWDVNSQDDLLTKTIGQTINLNNHRFALFYTDTQSADLDVRLEDSAGNWSEWNAKFKSVSIGSGNVFFLTYIDTDETASRTSGTLDKTGVTKFHFVWRGTSSETFLLDRVSMAGGFEVAADAVRMEMVTTQNVTGRELTIHTVSLDTVTATNPDVRSDFTTQFTTNVFNEKDGEVLENAALHVTRAGQVGKLRATLTGAENLVGSGETITYRVRKWDGSTDSVLGSIVFDGSADHNSGLVGYWNMDEKEFVTSNGFVGVEDLIGDNDMQSNGTWNGGWTEARFGKFGIEFAGGGAGLNGLFQNTPHGGSQSLPEGTDQPWSISLWVKARDLSDAAHQMLFIYGTKEDGVGWIDGEVPHIKASNDGISVGTGDGAGNELFEDPGTSPFRTNQWHHLVVTVDASKNIKLYIDGVENNSGTVTTNNPMVTRTNQDRRSQMRVGYSPEDFDGGTNPQPYDGLMDEVRVYDRAITADEVGQLFRANSFATTKETTIDASIVSGDWLFMEAELSGLSETVADLGWTFDMEFDPV